MTHERTYSHAEITHMHINREICLGLTRKRFVLLAEDKHVFLSKIIQLLAAQL